MIAEDFDRRTMANIEVALERMCERFPRELASHEARKEVAMALLQSAREGRGNLILLNAAAERAAQRVVLRPR